MCNKKKLFFLFSVLILSLTFFVKQPFVHAKSFSNFKTKALENNINKNISPSIAIALSDQNGRIIYQKNKDKKLVPASILKILTSLAAIHFLSENFEFPTDYFFDEKSKNLYIKGYGDPLFISETIEKLCDKIILKIGSNKVDNIVLDQKYFAKDIELPGQSKSFNPYDAHVGALCANFNTITFKTKKNIYISAEKQTPLLDIFYDEIKKTKQKQGRIIISKKKSLLYPGHLIKHFLEQKGVIIKGDVLLGDFIALKQEKASFVSEFTLTTLIQKLLKYSNNYMANQLLLVIGAKTYQAPATMQKGIKAIKLFAKQHLKINDLDIVEGSGLSRENRISANQMIKILVKFMPFNSLLNKNGNDLFKTGTLSNVTNRAGFIKGENSKLYPYVIMINQKDKNYNTILKKLKKIVNNL